MTFWPISCVTLLLVLSFAADVHLECPPFWTRFGKFCYRFFGPPKSWQKAEDHCREFFTHNSQGHLASIHSPEENDFLLQLWKTSLVPHDEYLGHFVWLGFNDRAAEGTFSWSDGTRFAYKAWREGQPDNVDENQNCGCFWEFAWDDFFCDQTLPYLCRLPIEDEHVGYKTC